EFNMSTDAAVERANRRATTSLVLGLTSLTCSCFTGIPAVVLGLMSLSHVAETHRLRAIIGIATGSLLSFLVIVLALTAGPRDAQLAAAPRSAPQAASVHAAPTLPMPEDQAAFCALVEQSAAA